MSASVVIHRLGAGDVAQLRAMNALFARSFQDPESYASQPPDDAYLQRLLQLDHVVALAALCEGAVVGGLVAYELDKFEQARREFYIYDLAVEAAHRRRGVATALIDSLRVHAHRRDAWVIYVQADYGDEPAIALYQKLGAREDVMHFDIPVLASRSPD
jgi:aminoglycoside 3-N-acetyltransferase I